jgi:dienelactone hydrolase
MEKTNMTLNTRGGKSLVKMVFAGAALAALLAFSAVPRANAGDRDDCQRRVSKADHKLHEAIEHHGWNSRQADHARHELHEARERCWNEQHRWWDEDGHRWRGDRDWDDHDHDRH